MYTEYFINTYLEYIKDLIFNYLNKVSALMYNMCTIVLVLYSYIRMFMES